MIKKSINFVRLGHKTGRIQVDQKSKMVFQTRHETPVGNLLRPDSERALR